MRAIAALVLSGCSFVMTSRPADVTHGELPECPTSSAPVIVDGVAAIAPLAIGSLMTYLGIANRNDDGRIGIQLGLPTLAVGLVFVGSAIYGKLNTDGCSDRIDESLAMAEADAASGNCEPVLAFARQLVRRDPRAALLFVHEEAVAKCLPAE